MLTKLKIKYLFVLIFLIIMFDLYLSLFSSHIEATCLALNPIVLPIIIFLFFLIIISFLSIANFVFFKKNLEDIHFSRYNILFIISFISFYFIGSYSLNKEITPYMYNKVYKNISQNNELRIFCKKTLKINVPISTLDYYILYLKNDEILLADKEKEEILSVNKIKNKLKMVCDK